MLGGSASALPGLAARGGGPRVARAAARRRRRHLGTVLGLPMPVRTHRIRDLLWQTIYIESRRRTHLNVHQVPLLVHVLIHLAAAARTEHLYDRLHARAFQHRVDSVHHECVRVRAATTAVLRALMPVRVAQLDCVAKRARDADP